MRLSKYTHSKSAALDHEHARDMAREIAKSWQAEHRSGYARRSKMLFARQKRILKLDRLRL